MGGGGAASDGETARTLAALDAVVKRMALRSSLPGSAPVSQGSSLDHHTSPASLSPTSSVGEHPSRITSLLGASSNWSSGASIDMSEDTLETITHVSGGSSPVNMGGFKRAHSSYPTTQAYPNSSMRPSHGSTFRRTGSMVEGPAHYRPGGHSPENKSPTLSRNISPMRNASPSRQMSPSRRCVGALEFDITPCIEEEDMSSARALISDIDNIFKKQGSANRLINEPLYSYSSGQGASKGAGRRKNSRVMKVQSALGYVSAGDLEGITKVPTNKDRLMSRINPLKAQTMDADMLAAATSRALD
mmetsp:Transcript_40693/g.99985  ORF Transcript_40693/g.99985 Transcript_40693/m.99985 type:complete len:303 (+) Transcript_40693:2-910(+)